MSGVGAEQASNVRQIRTVKLETCFAKWCAQLGEKKLKYIIIIMIEPGHA